VSERDPRRFDLAVLAGLGAALALGLAIRPPLELATRPPLEPEASALRLFGWALPSTCWFRLLTGWPCAGCGMTRAVVLALHGELRAAWQTHPFALPLLALGAAQAGIRLAGLAGWSRLRRRAADRAFVAALTALLALLLVWWGLRLAGAWAFR
jgi:hypothetical protein